MANIHQLGRVLVAALMVAAIFNGIFLEGIIIQKEAAGATANDTTVRSGEEAARNVSESNHLKTPAFSNAASSSTSTISSNKPNKPLAFVHFHKAGGTSMVKLFTEHLTQWNPSRNGNPWGYKEDGREYLRRFWNYDQAKMDSFLAEQPSAQFLALEWNFFTQVQRDFLLDRLQLITCLRDPYQRFASNLFVNNFRPAYKKEPLLWMLKNYTRGRGKPAKGEDFPVNYNKPNYYVAFLNGLADIDYDSNMLNEKHLEIAKERLQWFAAILILENPETHSVVEQFLPLSTGIDRLPKKNVNQNRHGAQKMINMTREEFNALNHLDVQLYEYAVDLALSRIATK